MKLITHFLLAAAVLGAEGTADAAEEKVRIALKAETVAGGKVRIGVEKSVAGSASLSLPATEWSNGRV